MSRLRPAACAAALLSLARSLPAGAPTKPAGARLEDPVRARAGWLAGRRWGAGPRTLPGASAPSSFAARAEWAPVAPASGAAWTVKGAAGFAGAGGLQQGRAAAVWINPGNGNEIWAGFAGGGVWKTLDGGATWTPLGDRLASLSIGALTLDRTGGRNRVFVGTGEGNFTGDGTLGLGVYVSLDGGASFVLSALPWDAAKVRPDERSLHRIAFDPNSSDHTTLYAAADGGLFKGTLDAATGMVNWGTAPLKGGGTYGVNDFPYTGLFSCARTGAASYPLIAITDVVIDASASPSAVYAAVGIPFDDPNCTNPYEARKYNGVYRTSDGGANFTNLRRPGLGGFTPVGTGTGPGRIALALANPEANATPLPRRLFALVHDLAGDGLDAVYSAQNPATATQTTGWVRQQPANFLAAHGWYSLAIAGDPAFFPANAAAASRLFAGGPQVNLSNDSAASWSAVSAAPAVFGEIHDLAVTADGLTLAAATDGGIYRGAVSGNSVAWSNLNGGGLNTLQFFGLGVNPSAPAAMNGGALDAGELRTAGAGWSAASCGIACGDGGQTLFASATTVFGEGPYGALRRSTDGGATFACVRNFGGCAGCASCVPDWQTAYVAPLASDGAGGAITASIRLYKYGAAAFTALPANGDLVSSGLHNASATVTAIAAAPANPLIIYAGTSDGQIWRTLNGGATAADWTNISLAATPVLPASQSSTDALLRPVAALLVSPADPAKLLALYGGFSSQTPTRPGHFFLSTNAASTSTTTPPAFSNIAPAGEPDLPVESAILLNAGADLYAGLDRGVARVADVFNTASARQFEDVTGNAPNAAYFALAATPAGWLRAASHGRGVWELDPGTIRAGAALPVADGRPVGGAATRPLRIAKAGAQFTASWDVSGVCNSNAYNLYAGPLTAAALAAGYTLSAAPVCNATSGSATFADPGAGQSFFFLAGGSDGAATGATGSRLSQNSAGAYLGSGAGFCAVSAAAAAVCN